MATQLGYRDASSAKSHIDKASNTLETYPACFLPWRAESASPTMSTNEVLVLLSAPSTGVIAR